MQTLLFCKYCDHNESMKINAFTKHPKVVAAQHVLVKKLKHFAAYLSDKWKSINLQTDSGQMMACAMHSLGKQANTNIIGEIQRITTHTLPPY